MTDLATTYATHRGPLIALATRILAGDRDAAEDVVHTVVIRQLTGANPLDTAAGWHRAVHNMAVDRIRADHRQRNPDRWARLHPLAEPDHADTVCSAVDAAASPVHAAVAVLPPRLRDVVRMRYHDDLTNDAVAARLGVDKSAASRLHTTALTALRAQLADAQHATWPGE